ncbi:Oligoxyloglucan reducing end-specific cellobiohydrolase [Dacryopinax primogenitus]|uniref:Vacuolar protein sorting/targeting protein 10 n=1 Tax=Dacryopinax primogenitus (strain DJM 731) TaxID=1858805 RepID=M5G6S6_DACPD|nr:Oligoxyloglucan reducing end-specific cellobiohydrolase [Dacryopinax primogenitus]EJU03910.1 Oligoxyloglucan reducing end-specific cellobiohydrolase [Dacryopinax primogenitus]
MAGPLAQLRVTLFLLVLLFPLTTRADIPLVTLSYFSTLPSKLFYFDDSTSVLWHDTANGIVFVSEDEGKSWTQSTDIPEGEAAMLVEHPFDTKVAFMLSRKYTHYRTINRGKTWQTFETPIPPALTSTPLSFHATEPGYVLFHGTRCENTGIWWGRECHDEAYYSLDQFSDDLKLLLTPITRCVFARSTKDFLTAPERQVLCVGIDVESSEGHAVESSRLYTSEDFFDTDGQIVNFGRGKQGRGVVALGVVSKFIVVALKDLVNPDSGEMVLYVSVDAQNWAHARFPHGSGRLLENAYTIVESTTHSLAVDVLTHSRSTVGTLFVSNSNGTFFVRSLQNTNRNAEGFVDYEEIVGVEGVGLANFVANAEEVDGRGQEKQLRTVITFDDGSSWDRLPLPTDLRGNEIACPNENCTLHLHSVSTPHNLGRIFSSPAPGFVMGVGSVGDYLLPYEECDTFLSSDAGLHWKRVAQNANMYEFGGQGSIIVIVDDEDYTDHVLYSYDSGTTWHDLKFGVNIRARGLTTVPDSTSQKFLLLGTLSRKDQNDDGRHVSVFLDFAPLQKRQCGASDFEKWYARTAKGHECVMGHKQYYNRRKADADCYVGHKFEDPIEFEENCACTAYDYECDYNFVSMCGNCVAAGPEPIPSGVCTTGRESEQYQGSSGYRLIPGNTCDKKLPGAVVKDEKVLKDCSNAAVPEGEATHQTFQFPAPILQHFYFKNSPTILVQLEDHTVWQSPNEGYSWTQLHPDLRFLAIYMHAYSDDRAYIITDSRKVLYTTSTGRDWYELETPTDVNTFRVALLQFHPTRRDWIIWTGQQDCNVPGGGTSCRTTAHYSQDNGRRWYEIENYVKQCTWGRDKNLKIDERLIVCESFAIKSGNMRLFGLENPLQLVAGRDLYSQKVKLFDNVVGLAKFSEYMIVAELGAQNTLDLQVSLDGKTFATGLFPAEYKLDNHAYTILESSTDSVFLHVTMSTQWGAEYGSILKSNSNGTYYGVSLDYANRNDAGYVDFEKNQGLDGIAVANVLTNPDEALLTGKKRLQTRITHNDGGSWKPIPPPSKDSLGQPYDCTSTKCTLNIHGYTERRDARATYSSPAATGLMMAVGSVGEALASYTESDIFLTRDAGFTWEEVHKDAHMWEFGDSGSLLVIVNDEKATDYVLFTTDEGLNWREYHFGDTVRINTLVNAPSDTSRKFLMFGESSTQGTVAIHLDFTQLTKKQCKFDIEDQNNDDFELWSPSEEREEQCLFGRQVAYYRRLRDRNCYIGDMKPPGRLVHNCICKRSDFECEFNHRRNDAGECVLVAGAEPLPSSMADQCMNGEEFWYDRTAYRKIPFSTCEGGEQLNLGKRHDCPGLQGKSFFFWLSVIVLPAGLVSLLAYWFYKRSGHMKGTIRLPDGMTRPSLSTDAGLVDTIASVPWYLLGLATVAITAIENIRIPWLSGLFRSRRGYRTVAVDEDAQVLRFEDEES